MESAQTIDMLQRWVGYGNMYDRDIILHYVVFNKTVIFMTCEGEHEQLRVIKWTYIMIFEYYTKGG